MTFPRAIRLSRLAWLFAPAALAAFGSALAPSARSPAALAAGTPAALPHPHYREHLALLGADHWHAEGVTGRGVKVAVLDSGFRGYRAFLGTALPERVVTASFRADGDLEARDSRHGILCGEVIHAIAPEAELLLANWEPDHPDAFLRAVAWARGQGAKVLSCSVVMPGWSDGHGGGAVHAALARIAGPGDRPGDLLCFASAGNLARRCWAGRFRDGGGGVHEWAPGRRENTLLPWGGRTVSVEWTTPSPVASRYELEVTDAETGEPVGVELPLPARGVNGGAVRFTPVEGRRYRLRMYLAEGEGGPVRVVALGGGLELWTANGSVSFPGDGPALVAVGAVGPGGEPTEYSSRGPNSPEPKPDLVAPVPFPSRWRAYPFTGTSAAAPQAAALAALWWSRHPDRTAAEVRRALCRACRDLEAPGHDWETGYGLVRLSSNLKGERVAR